MKNLARRALRLLVVAATTAVVLLAGAALLIRQPTAGSLPRVPAPRADPHRLRSHVRFLAEEVAPRDVDHPRNLSRAADYVAGVLQRNAPRFERQRYAIRGATYENEIARYGPPEGRPLVVGAHYDACGEFGPNPGADDNASGVAGLLELARLLAGAEVTVPVELVAYSTEEPPYFATPFMGSSVHAKKLAAEGRPPVAMLCLEMIGYYTERQPWPNPLFNLAYTRRGDFLSVAGRWRDRHLMRSFKRAFRGASDLPVYSLVGTANMLDASDQRSYWQHDWPAILVTDTAFVRNPSYHTAADTAETLDYEKMALVVDGLANVVLQSDRSR